MTTNSTNSSACASNMTEFHGGGGSFTNNMPLNSGAVAIGIVLMVIAYTVVGLRIANSCRKGFRLFTDDCLCSAALLLATVYIVLEIVGMHRHSHEPLKWGQDWNVSMCSVKKSRARLYMAGILVYYPAMTLAKASVCAQYLRLFRIQQWLCRTTWTILIIYTFTCAYAFGAHLMKDIQGDWNGSPNSGIDKRPAVVMQAASTLLIDLVLLLLPIRPILKLKLSLRKRVGTLAVFLVGFGGCACTAILLHCFIQHFYYHRPSSGRLSNLLRGIELLTTIILGCVPGVVCAWRHIIRDTVIVTRIRALFSNIAKIGTRKELARRDDEDPFKVVNNDRNIELAEI